MSLDQLRVRHATADVQRYSAFVAPLCAGDQPATYAMGESAKVMRDSLQRAASGMGDSAMKIIGSTSSADQTQGDGVELGEVKAKDDASVVKMVV